MDNECKHTLTHSHTNNSIRLETDRNFEFYGNHQIVANQLDFDNRIIHDALEPHFRDTEIH